jgi:hypothetical protein
MARILRLTREELSAQPGHLAKMKQHQIIIAPITHPLGEGKMTFDSEIHWDGEQLTVSN